MARIPVAGVFEGGGVRAIALAGAASAAIDSGYHFESAVGTSGGAIVAATVMSGFTPDTMRSGIGEIVWPALLSRPISGRFLGGLANHVAIMRRRGVDSGDRLEAMVAALLARHGVVTFADLAPGSLRLVTTDIRHGRGVTIPDDLGLYGIDPGSFSVARAVHMSAAVPFVFEPVPLNRPGQAKGLFVDGAFAARFPAQVAEPGRRVIGFRIAPQGMHPHHEVRGPLSLAAAVMSAGMTAREFLPSSCPDLDTVVTVAVERPPLDFDLTPSQAVALFDDGYAQATQQLGGSAVPWSTDHRKSLNQVGTDS